MKSARVLPVPCPSETETSSIISVSEAHPPSLQVSLMESQKEERKQAEEEKMEDVEGDDDEDHNKDQLEDTEAKAEDLVLDLSLSNEDSNHGSNTELNLIDSFDTNSSRNNSSSDISPPQGNENEPRVFSCNYCQRKFYSSQALGGHQNAHKRERTLAKRGHKTAAFGFPTSLPHRSYSSIASLPLHGSFNRSPLGIQVHSLIHKPSNYHNYHPNPIASSHFYGRNGWLTIPIDQQPAIGRLALENFHVPAATVGSSSGGAARFETVKKFSQQVSEGTGGFCWNSTVGHPKTKQDDHLKKLDLSLKL